MVNLKSWKRWVVLGVCSSALSVCSSFTLQAWAQLQVGVSPPIFEFKLQDRTPTQSFKVINYSQKPVTFRVSVHNWTLNESGDTQILPPTENSLDQWIVVNPVEFTVPARGEQTVRFAVRPKVPPQAGEYRAMFFLDTVPDPNATGVVVQGRLAIASYAYMGDVTRVGTLEGITIRKNPLTAGFTVKSEGTAHLRLQGQYAIYRANNYPGAAATKPIENVQSPQAQANLPTGVLAAGTLPTLPTLPGSRRKIQLSLPANLGVGSYILDINGTLGDKTIDQAVPFSIP